ncbi:MAG: hypothetical protein FWF35_02015 [Elusimicrobia bacterium]|nr:hypothetical protein [Elusimicrobiota bacterium]
MKQIFKLFLFLIPCAAAAQQLPPGLLGGMLKSDSWVIRKDAQQEEFKGNVSYDSGLYKLKSDYALSDRAKNTFTLDGNVYLMNKDTAGAMTELYSKNAVFNTLTQQGRAAAYPQKPLQIFYTVPDIYKVEAQGKTLNIDGKKQTLELKDNVKIKYTEPYDFALAFADTAFIDRAKNTARLTGNAELDNKNYTARAEDIFYDGAAGLITVTGNYPLFTMVNDDASAALQSDKVTVNTVTKNVEASGRISGWVAPKQTK